MITQYLISGHWINSFFFMMELTLCSAVLSFSQKKFSWKRAIIAMAVFVLIILFVPSFPPNEFMEAHPSLSTAIEIILLISCFLAESFLMKYVFRQSMEKMVFCAIAAYSIQNLMYNIVSLIVTAFSKAGFSRDVIVFFQEPISLILCATLSFVLRSKLHSVGSVEMNNVTLLTILLLAILEYAILGHLVEGVALQYLYIYKCYAMTADLLILYLQFSLLAKQSYKRKYYMTQMLWEKDKKNYEIKKSAIEEMNQRVHDLKHILSAVGPYMNKESLLDLESSVKDYEAMVRTGCLPLVVVLADKWEYCQKHDIRFTFLGDGNDLNFMDETDLYSLFTNILDNAIEAVVEINDPKERVISFTLSKKEGVILLLCRNFYLHTIQYGSKGNIKTSKENKEFHGYGLKSISSIASKYGGHMTVRPEDNIFELSILFEKSDN